MSHSAFITLLIDSCITSTYFFLALAPFCQQQNILEHFVGTYVTLSLILHQLIHGRIDQPHKVITQEGSSHGQSIQVCSTQGWWAEQWILIDKHLWQTLWGYFMVRGRPLDSRGAWGEGDRSCFEKKSLSRMQIQNKIFVSSVGLKKSLLTRIWKIKCLIAPCGNDTNIHHTCVNVRFSHSTSILSMKTQV